MLTLLDNSLRLMLVVLSLASFVPQVNRIRSNGNCNGISIFYLLFNTIVATYNLTMMIFIALDSDYLMEPSIGTRDWLNLAQFAVAWLGQLVLSYLVLTLPPYRPAQKITAIVTYLSFLAVSLVPTILQMLIPPEGRVWLSAILFGFLLFLVGPAMQVLGLAAQSVQAREIRSRDSASALSVRSLVVQAVVFLLVGILFLFRFNLPPVSEDEHFIIILRDWYWTVGWATINNIIFGLAQGSLARIALHQGGGADYSERSALLA